MVAKFRRIKKGGSYENIFFSVLLVLLLLLTISFLVVTNLKINQRRAKLISQIEILKKETQILEEKNEELKAKISQAGSKDYLEKVAREQLGLKSPGEEVVVITKEKGEEKEIKEEKKSWWEQMKRFWNLLK